MPQDEVLRHFVLVTPKLWINEVNPANCWGLGVRCRMFSLKNVDFPFNKLSLCIAEFYTEKTIANYRINPIDFYWFLNKLIRSIHWDSI